MVITGSTSVISSSSVSHVIIMYIQCLQRVLKWLGVLAELPDGTGEVTRPCDEVAPSSIQGHVHYPLPQLQIGSGGWGGWRCKKVNQPCTHHGRLNACDSYGAFRAAQAQTQHHAWQWGTQVHCTYMIHAVGGSRLLLVMYSKCPDFYTHSQMIYITTPSSAPSLALPSIPSTLCYAHKYMHSYTLVIYMPHEQ